MTKNNMELKIFSILIIALFITRVFETPFLILFADLKFFLQNPLDESLYKIPLSAIIARVYSVSYFLGLIGLIGLFFAKKWSRLLLTFYALCEILATLTGFHEGTKIMHNFSDRFFLYYNIQGIFLALVLLVALNFTSIKNKLN